MKELPDDLATMETDDLVQQGVVRDELLAPLFRRWPQLSRIELRQLKNLYAERVRIASYLGRLGAVFDAPRHLARKPHASARPDAARDRWDRPRDPVYGLTTQTSRKD